MQNEPVKARPVNVCTADHYEYGPGRRQHGVVAVTAADPGYPVVITVAGRTRVYGVRATAEEAKQAQQEKLAEFYGEYTHLLPTLPRITLYVSGKYRDPRGTYYIEQNIRAAEAVGAELWSMGFSPLVPHANTKHLDGYTTVDNFLAGDLTMVGLLDAIIMLPGWENSRGARCERGHAMFLGKPVLYWPLRKEDIEEQVKLQRRVG